MNACACRCQEVGGHGIDAKHQQQMSALDMVVQIPAQDRQSLDAVIMLSGDA